MNEYFQAKIWDSLICPPTNEKATEQAISEVKNCRVIYVEDAKYRGASINGVFCIPESEVTELDANGKKRVEVYALWHGHRLKTRGLKILVDLEKAIASPSYTGLVVTNISI